MKNKLISVLLCFVLLFAFFPTFVFSRDTELSSIPITDIKGGNKVQSGGVYEISSSDDFFYFASVCNAENNYFEGATVILTADIDINPGWAAGAAAPSKVWEPIAMFKGKLDGKNHTLRGIYATARKWNDNENTTGIFVSFSGNVEIRNLVIANSYFVSDKYSSALVGVLSRDDGRTARKIKIEGVKISADVVTSEGGSYGGGFIGMILGPADAESVVSFDSCVFSGTLTAPSGGAGFVGVTWRNVEFKNSVFTGKVSSTMPGNKGQFIGGFLALIEAANTTFTRCFGGGELNVSGNGTTVVIGGFVGKSGNGLYGTLTLNFTDCLNSSENNIEPGNYITGGYVGIFTFFEASFLRCLNLSKSINASIYYNMAFIGKLEDNAKDNSNTANKTLAFKDCYYLLNDWTTSTGAYAQARGVGFYLTGPKSHIIRTVYTKSGTDITFSLQTLTGVDWENLFAANKDFVSSSVLKANEISGAAALASLSAFDFTDVWTIYDNLPMPKNITSLLPNANIFDAKLITGTLDSANKIMTDAVNTPTYNFAISTASKNKIQVFRDSELTAEMENPVLLKNNGENIFYIKLSTANGEKSEVWTAKITTTGANLLKYDLSDEVRFLGRTYSHNGTRYFNWTASGFEIAFKGSGIEAVLISNAGPDAYKAYVKVYVDGAPLKKIKLEEVSQKVTLASGLDPEKPHTVKVVMISGNGKSATAGVSDITLTGGTKLAAPAAAGLKMEIIGDSISVGYGNLGKSTDAWSTETEDGTLTYAALAARALGMDYNVIAASGRGIYMNYGGSTAGKIPDIYDFTDGYNGGKTAWDFAGFVPDVIVINLGTNDASNASVTSENFKAALENFLKNVRQKNPGAWIIYAYEVMGNKFAADIKSTIDKFTTDGDAKISYLQLSALSAAEKGVSSHPTLAAHTGRAEVLLNKIKALTGFDIKQDITAIIAAEQDISTEVPKSDKLPPTFDPDKIIIPDKKDPSESTETTAATTATQTESTSETAEPKGCKGKISQLPFIAAIITLSGALMAGRKRKLGDQ